MNPLDKILLGIGAALALAVTVGIVTLVLINAHLRVELAEAQANDSACKVANDDFRQKTEQQDQAIADLRTAGEAHARQAEASLQAAEKTAATYQSDAARLAKQTASGDDCKAAARLFDAYVGGAK